MKTNYYKVKCKCGHVGRDKYIPIDFAIIALSGKEAALIARNIPRCKHHHKDCVLDVTKISYEEYRAIQINNKNDPYLNCKCIQEQRQFDISNRIVSETKKRFKHNTKITNHELFSKKEKIRKPKSYIRFNPISECYKTFDLGSLSC